MIGLSRKVVVRLIADIIFVMSKVIVGRFFWGKFIIQVLMRRPKRVHSTLIFLSSVYVFVFIVFEARVLWFWILILIWIQICVECILYTFYLLFWSGSVLIYLVTMINIIELILFIRQLFITSEPTTLYILLNLFGESWEKIESLCFSLSFHLLRGIWKRKIN